MKRSLRPMTATAGGRARATPGTGPHQLAAVTPTGRGPSRTRAILPALQHEAGLRFGASREDGQDWRQLGQVKSRRHRRQVQARAARRCRSRPDRDRGMNGTSTLVGPDDMVRRMTRNILDGMVLWNCQLATRVDELAQEGKRVVIVECDHGDESNVEISVLAYGTKEVLYTGVHRDHDEADVMIEKMGAEQQSAHGRRPDCHAPR